MAQEEWLTTSEVAERLKVTGATVQRWLRSGELVGVYLGGQAGWRIAAAELAAFLERKTRSGEV